MDDTNKLMKHIYIIIAAQVALHLAEPFVDRYIIRGTFAHSDEKGWHTADFWQWVAIYLFGFACYSAGVETFSLSLFVYLAVSGLAMRFFTQSFVLNQLMMEDGHNGREWYTLRPEGSDKKVVDAFKYIVRHTKYRDLQDEEVIDLKVLRYAQQWAIKASVAVVLITIIIFI